MQYKSSQSQTKETVIVSSRFIIMLLLLLKLQTSFLQIAFTHSTAAEDGIGHLVTANTYVCIDHSIKKIFYCFLHIYN